MRRLSTGVAGVAVALLLASSIHVETQTVPDFVGGAVKHKTGQTVAPVFEGWEPNEDGTFSLFFGYMNRNYEEELDIPIGPSNKVEPGIDRGQPTHFMPRRHQSVFRVIVPKDFGRENKIEWTISFRGNTEKVAGTLNPLYVISVSKMNVQRLLIQGLAAREAKEDAFNRPPIIKVDSELKVAMPNPLSLTAWVADDGIGRGKLRVIWSKYRGPGNVTFANATPELKADQATTTATFSEPGDYILLLTADDGTMMTRFTCCYSRAQVKVKVGGASRSG